MMTSSNGNIFRVTDPLCGEFTGQGEFPKQRPVTRSFDVYFDLRLNKMLSKQQWDWWFETPSLSLWRNCYGHIRSSSGHRNGKSSGWLPWSSLGTLKLALTSPVTTNTRTVILTTFSIHWKDRSVVNKCGFDSKSSCHCPWISLPLYDPDQLGMEPDVYTTIRTIQGLCQCCLPAAWTEAARSASDKSRQPSDCTLIVAESRLDKIR